MMKQLLILFIALGATFANLFEDTTVTPPPVEAGEQHNYHGLFDEENTDDTERIICDSVVAIAFAVHPKDVSSVKQREQQQQQGLRRAKSEKDGFDDQQDIDEEEVEEYFHKEEEFACQSAEYGLVPITGTDEQMKELRESLANGTLVSTVSTLAVELEDDTEDDANSGGTDAIASAEDEPNTHSKSGKLPAGPVHLLDDTERRLSGGEPHRRLNQYDKLVGTQKLLVLYVVSLLNVLIVSSLCFSHSHDSFILYRKMLMEMFLLVAPNITPTNFSEQTETMIHRRLRWGDVVMEVS